MDTPLEWRRGSCHCRAIQFEVLIPRTVDVYRCNCSICFMKQVSLRCSPLCLALSAHPAARAADFICILTACASCRITILLSGPTKYAGFQAMMGWTGQTA